MSRWLAAACSFLVVCGAATADRLHLDGGGVIVADRWWVEDDTLHYSNGSGTVGLPRSMVARIERTDGSTETDETSAATAPAVTEAPTEKNVRLVTREVAERMQDANAALAAGDFEKAASLYSLVMSEVDLDLMDPRIGYALAQLKLGEDDMALAVVLDGLARQPHEPALLELLGDLRNREERVSDAVRAWRDAFAHTPNDRLRDKIMKGERELHAGRGYELSMSSHFNMRFDGKVDDALAEAVTDYLEEQYWTMADLFDLAPRQPITVVLYPRKQFSDVTQMPEWVGGLYDGKIRVPLGGLTRLNPVAHSLLRHELAHAFAHEKSRGRCPRWLHEGLAQILEGRALTPANRESIVRRLREVDPVAWDDSGFSYPLSLSLTLHLRDLRGVDGLVRVLERLAEGLDTDAALADVFGATYEGLCRDWASAALQEGMR